MKNNQSKCLAVTLSEDQLSVVGGLTLHASALKIVLYNSMNISLVVKSHLL